MIIGVYDAKVRLSQLLQRVEAGEEVVITRDRKPVARLVPVAQPNSRVRLVRKLEAPPDELKRIGRRRLKLMAQFDPKIPPYDLDELIEEARGG